MSVDKPHYVPENRVPLPPPDAEVLTTACDYCIVACGYKAYRWPIGSEGGPAAHENALGLDFPVGPMSGAWISPNQYNQITHNGKPHHVVVIADKDTKAVNLYGDHSIRGGTIAQKFYNPDKPTRERLQYPQLRVNGKLERISWDDAFDIMTNVSKHVTKKHGKDSWAMKMYSYQYWENTHALTRVALRHMRTAAFAVHDQPTGHGPDTPGLSDAGIDPFNASYEDWSMAETLVLCGTDPFESKTIVFNEWIKKGIDNGMKVIFINPRKTTGVAFAEARGGLHLALTPGTDTVLYTALARIIMENGWEDSEFISKYINTKAEVQKEVFQADGFDDYKQWILAQPWTKVDKAAEITGVPADQIQKAAEMMAKPVNGRPVKTSIGIEKGCYWSNNYLNTASVASMGLICGAGNRPGQVIGRLGGHQRGMMPGGSYPEFHAYEKFPHWRKKGIDLDRYVEDGHVRFVWVVGTTWMQAMTASQHFKEVFEGMTAKSPYQVTSKDKNHAIKKLKERADNGGMVVIHQDIYPVTPIGTQFADLVLPAATWGEDNFARANGERRIRLYSKIADAPGEAKPDWWIAAQFATRMGFKGMDWKESHEVFEEAAWWGKKRRTSYFPLVIEARRQGKTGHELLREYGTTGIQAPIRYEKGKLVGTKKLHDAALKTGTPDGLTNNDHKWLTNFKTKSGKANLLKTPWEIFEDFYNHIKPREEDGEVWVTSGRINEFWQSGFDDLMRRPYLRQRWPENFVEMHPDDAKKFGLENGDMISLESERVPVQVGGYGLEDAGVRGVLMDDRLTKEDEPDLLEQAVSGDRKRKSRRHTGMTADIEGDMLLSSFDAPPAFQDEDQQKEPELDDQIQEDPLMEWAETGVGITMDELKPMLFETLLKKGYIKHVKGGFKAVVMVTPAVRPGVVFTYFLVPGAPANSLSPRVLDPVSQRPRYKLGTGKVRKLGESPYKHSHEMMTFVPRIII